MRLSVVINNYNYGRYVGAAIDSVLAQTHGDFELIIVDDGSSDDSREVIGRYRDSRIRTIFQANQGQGAALKAGFAAASGDAIALLDSDDEWHPQKLALCADVLKNRPDISLLQHGLEIVDRSSRLVRQQPSTHVGDYDPMPDYARLKFELPFGPTSCVVGNRSYFGRLAFDTAAWRMAADTPVIAGLSVLGRCHFLAENLTRYRVHGENGFDGKQDPASLLALRRRFYQSVDDHLALLPGRHERHPFEKSSAYQSQFITNTSRLSLAGIRSRLGYRLALLRGR